MFALCTYTLYALFEYALARVRIYIDIYFAYNLAGKRDLEDPTWERVHVFAK